MKMNTDKNIAIILKKLRQMSGNRLAWLVGANYLGIHLEIS
jgi:hypothetical protein